MAELTPRWRKRGYDLDFGAGIALGYATCEQRLFA
jgi:aryl carrier-like protein